MEGISATMYKGIRGYWRRRGYQRLGSGGGARRSKTRVVEFGSKTDQKRRRFWRFKLRLRLRFSPKKFLVGLRDAYVNMMMRIAATPSIGGYFGGGGGDVFGMRAVKEYDERTIVEIYKSIVVAQGQLVPREPSWICSEIAFRR